MDGQFLHIQEPAFINGKAFHTGNYLSYPLKRSRVLKASGDDPRLIRDLLHDARLLEILKKNLLDQSDKLAESEQQYLSDSSQSAHEMPIKEVKSKMNEFNRARKKLQRFAEHHFRTLASSSQKLIQLVLHQIPHAESSSLT